METLLGKIRKSYGKKNRKMKTFKKDLSILNIVEQFIS